MRRIIQFLFVCCLMSAAVIAQDTQPTPVADRPAPLQQEESDQILVRMLDALVLDQLVAPSKQPGCTEVRSRALCEVWAQGYGELIYWANLMPRVGPKHYDREPFQTTAMRGAAPEEMRKVALDLRDLLCTIRHQEAAVTLRASLNRLIDNGHVH